MTVELTVEKPYNLLISLYFPYLSPADDKGIYNPDKLLETIC